MLCNYVKISRNEWEFIKAMEDSLNLLDISKKTKISYSNIYRIYDRLRSKVDFFFHVNYKKINLLPILILINDNEPIKYVNNLTISIRKIYGTHSYYLIYALVPCIYKEKYVKSFNIEPVTIVEGLETQKWRPSYNSNIYSPNQQLLMPVFSSWMDDIENLYKPVSVWESSSKAPDPIDITIILGKLKNPYTSILNIVRTIRKYDSNIPILSKQVLSYHYRNHVLKCWLYNTINLYFDSNLVPFRLFYFEGPDAHIVARILTRYPMFYRALIDKDKAIVFGQPPGNIFENIYRIISMFDVEMPLGDLIVSLENMAWFITPLWKYIENNKWIWIDKKIKVKN